MGLLMDKMLSKIDCAELLDQVCAGLEEILNDKRLARFEDTVSRRILDTFTSSAWKEKLMQAIQGNYCF
jgi:hypothetical protein